MQKWGIAFAAALVVCLVSMYINYRSYQERHYLEWSYRNHGGEITIEFAPGWHAVHIYAMRPEDYDSHKLVFSPLPLAIALFVFTLAGRAALALVSLGEPWKDFFMLLIGFAVIIFGCRVIVDFWDDYA